MCPVSACTFVDFLDTAETPPLFYTPAVEIEIYRSGRTDKHDKTNNRFSSCFLEVFKHPNKDKTDFFQNFLQF
jgi:hypothetical protein